MMIYLLNIMNIYDFVNRDCISNEHKKLKGISSRNIATRPNMMLYHNDTGKQIEIDSGEIFFVCKVL
jgi:hypothetical protein